MHATKRNRLLQAQILDGRRAGSGHVDIEIIEMFLSLEVLERRGRLAQEKRRGLG